MLNQSPYFSFCFFLFFLCDVICQTNQPHPKSTTKKQNKQTKKQKVIQLDLVKIREGFLFPLGPHGREQQHLSNGKVVGQQHSKAIDTQTPSSGGRKPIFQSLDEVLIDVDSLEGGGVSEKEGKKREEKGRKGKKERKKERKKKPHHLLEP